MRTSPGTPVYWSFNRFLVVLASVVTLATPGLYCGLAEYAFIGPMLVPSLAAPAVILWKDCAWTFLTAGILGSLFPAFAVLMFGVLGGQFGNLLDRSGYLAIVTLLVALTLSLAGGTRAFATGAPAPTSCPSEPDASEATASSPCSPSGCS